MVCFIILTYLVPTLFTFYIQAVLKLKKNNSGAKRLKDEESEILISTRTPNSTHTFNREENQAGIASGKINRIQNQNVSKIFL